LDRDAIAFNSTTERHVDVVVEERVGCTSRDAVGLLA